MQLQTASTWKAHLTLGFGVEKGKHLGQSGNTGKTVLKRRDQYGPLLIQRPFYPEQNVCHVYLLHPPGGIVGGDQLIIDVQLEPDAEVLLTTPGATKFYRSAGPIASQQQNFTVNGGSLEWLPQENIFFPGTHSEVNAVVHLDDAAKYIGWEFNCLGRPAIHEALTHGSVDLQTQIFKNRLPLFLDRLSVRNEAELNGSAALRGHPVMATLVALPADKDILEQLQQKHLATLAFGHLGMTLVNEVLIVRYLGDSTAEAQRLFKQVWQTIRPKIMKRDAEMPRIWNT